MHAFSCNNCVWFLCALAALIVLCWLGDVPAAFHPKAWDTHAAVPVKKATARSKHTPALHFFFGDEPPVGDLPNPDKVSATDEAVPGMRLPSYVPPECRAPGGYAPEEGGFDSTQTERTHTRTHFLRRLHEALEAGPPAGIRKYEGVFLDSNDFVPPTDSSYARRVLRLLVPQRNSSCAFVAAACGPAGRALGLSLAAGSLGSCAMVGLGRNLLDSKYGDAIDGHDTVIRFGSAPTQGYEQYVGRATSINFVRETLEAEAGWRGRVQASGASRKNIRGSDVWDHAGRWHTPDKFYLYQGAKIEVARLHGLPYLHINTISYQDAGDRCYRELQGFVVPGSDNARNFPDKLKPTEGMRLVMSLLHSGLCSRLDLYGFSRSGMGHYFSGVSSNRNDARSGFVWKHVAALEYYVYEVAMANSLLCVFP